jgi:hypothetical protein
VNGKMKNKAIQKFSPFALGIIVYACQMSYGSMAYGAAIKSAAAANDALLKPDVLGLIPSSSGAALNCAPASATGSGSGLPVTSSPSTLKTNSLDASAPSSVLASSVAPSVLAANAPPVADSALAADASSNNLVAQVPALDDCCEIGGTTTCEVGGLAPQGGGALAGGFPLASLLGLLAPVAALPFVLGDDGGGGDAPTPPPVPEPSSTAAITAGLGLLGLWYGRRFRNPHKTSL